jgi:hypothetical protein
MILKVQTIWSIASTIMTKARRLKIKKIEAIVPKSVSKVTKQNTALLMSPASKTCKPLSSLPKINLVGLMSL